MSAIFFLIGCSVVLALVFLGAFFWANKTGQHEDTYTPSVRILFDDELVSEKKTEGEKVENVKGSTLSTSAKSGTIPLEKTL